MKKVLLLMTAVLMISSVAMASHFGIYTDATGSSCNFAPGFSPNVTLIEKFSTGSTSSRLMVNFGANGFFGFNTTFVPVGTLNSDISIGYGQCLNGSIVLGTAIVSLVGGQMTVLPATGFSFILYTDCSFAELPATGGQANDGTTGDCNEVATESSTWGQVKALYR
jgi:hypothetical protein